MLALRNPMLIMTLAAASCARDPLEATCPTVGVGGLVLTEIRGKQSASSDTLGQWIEIYNPGASAVGLGGLTVALTNLTGSTTTRIEVRSEAAEVTGHGYFVLGRFTAAAQPAYVDYAFGDGFPGDLPAGAGVDLVACGTVVDHVTYRSLPTLGTLSYDGARTPDATGNDVESAWCADTTGTGASGTPQQGNHPCTH